MRTYVNQCTSAQAALHSNLLLSILWVPWLHFLQQELCYRYQCPGVHQGGTKSVPSSAPWFYWQRSTQNPNCWRHYKITFCEWFVAIGKTIGALTAFFVSTFARDTTTETNYGTLTIWCSSCVWGLFVLYDFAQWTSLSFSSQVTIFLFGSSSHPWSDRTPSHAHIEHFPNWH